MAATHWRGTERMRDKSRTGQLLTARAPAAGVGWPYQAGPATVSNRFHRGEQRTLTSTGITVGRLCDGRRVGQCALGAGLRLETGAVNLSEVDAHADDRDRPAHVQEQARARVRVPEAGGGAAAGMPAARTMTADRQRGELGIAAAYPGQPLRRGPGPAPALARPVPWTVPRLHGWSPAPDSACCARGEGQPPRGCRPLRGSRPERGSRPPAWQPPHAAIRTGRGRSRNQAPPPALGPPPRPSCPGAPDSEVPAPPARESWAASPAAAPTHRQMPPVPIPRAGPAGAAAYCGPRWPANPPGSLSRPRPAPGGHCHTRGLAARDRFPPPLRWRGCAPGRRSHHHKPSNRRPQRP